MELVNGIHLAQDRDYWWPAEWLSVSQAGFCSMELTSHFCHACYMNSHPVLKSTRAVYSFLVFS